MCDCIAAFQMQELASRGFSAAAEIQIGWLRL
jgi:hypothetical protein